MSYRPCIRHGTPGEPLKVGPEQSEGTSQWQWRCPPDMLRRDRERRGMSVGEAGWRLGMTRREYVAIEDSERAPNSNEYEAIFEFFGWSDATRAVP